MGHINKGKWDARTYDQISRLVQYRWGTQVLKWRKWRGDEIVMDAGCGSGLLTKQLASSRHFVKYAKETPIVVPVSDPGKKKGSKNSHYAHLRFYKLTTMLNFNRSC